MGCKCFSLNFFYDFQNVNVFLRERLFGVSNIFFIVINDIFVLYINSIGSQGSSRLCQIIFTSPTTNGTTPK